MLALLMVCGLMVNGPYALITTAVSAELGTHKSLRGNAKALATVASIIDGTGSLGKIGDGVSIVFVHWSPISKDVLLSGAAVGPLLAGLISSSGWSNVFYMLMTADVLAMLVSGLFFWYTFVTHFQGSGIINIAPKGFDCFQTIYVLHINLFSY